MEINFFIFFARSKIVQARFVLCSYCWTGLTGLELIRIVFIEGKHGQAKLDRGTQISTVSGEKMCKKVKNYRRFLGFTWIFGGNLARHRSAGGG